MATLYDSGYGGDQGAGGYGGGYNPQLEEDRRRREQQRLQQQQQNPYQQQQAQAQREFRPQQPQYQSQGPGQQPNQQPMQPRPQQDQRTFAQRQQAGEARPAPPPPAPPPPSQNQQTQQAFNQAVPFSGPMPVSQMQPMPPGGPDAYGQQQIAQQYQSRMASFTPQQQQMSAQMGQQAAALGLDPMAAMMDPEGFQRQLAMMAQQQGNPANRMGGPPGGGPMGDTMPPPPDAAVAFNGPMVNSMGGPPLNTGFTGNIGEYLTNQLNTVGQGGVRLPNAYTADPKLGQGVADLAGKGLPEAPTYTMDPNLMAQLQQLTLNGRIGQSPGGQASAGADAGVLFNGRPVSSGAAGVSAAGVNPAAAMAQAPAQAPLSIDEQARINRAREDAQREGKAESERRQAAATGYNQAKYAGDALWNQLQSSGFAMRQNENGMIEATAANGTRRLFRPDGSRVAPQGMVYTPGNQLVREGTVFFGPDNKPMVPHPNGMEMVPLDDAAMRDMMERGVRPMVPDGRGGSVPYNPRFDGGQQGSAEALADLRQRNALATGGAGGAQSGVSAQGINPVTAFGAPPDGMRADGYSNGVLTNMSAPTSGGAPAAGLDTTNQILGSYQAAADQAQTQAAKKLSGSTDLADYGYERATTDLTDAQQDRQGTQYDAQQRAIADALANPSAFDNAEVKRLYEQMGQNIDDQFAQEETQLREEMAARGLSDSSIQGGRLADLNVGRRSARTELANQLATQRAQDFAQARAQAIGMAQQQRGQDLGEQQFTDQLDLSRRAAAFDQMRGTEGMKLARELGYDNLALERQLGLGNLDLNRLNTATGAQTALGRLALDTELGRGNLALEGELGRGNLALGQQRAGVDAELGRGNLALQGELGRGNLGIQQGRLSLDQQGQQFGQQMQGLQFQNQLGQQSFQNQLASGEFGLRRAGQAFDQGLRGATFQNMLGQQGFQNQMSVAELQRLFGNDAFSQRMGVTDRLTNYGQQAFQNDMSRAEFDARMQDAQWRRYLDSVALGG